MGTEIRLSHQGIRVLKALLDQHERDVRARLSGADVMRIVGLQSGTVYPLLLRFETHGIVESDWEEQPPEKLGRPRRRLYRLTAVGISTAQSVLSELVSASFLTSPDPVTP